MSPLNLKMRHIHMMKLATIILSLAFLLGISVFLFFALIDVPIHQKDVVKDIPYEHLSNAN
jgi:hypothetical protein